MSTSHEFRPDWVSSPGDTINDILQERALTAQDLANQLEASLEDTRDLIDGRATITLATARELERFLGGSVEFWMSRDFQYRQDTARLSRQEREWLSELPLGDMIRFGWLKPVPHPNDEVRASLRFFGVSTVQEWRSVYAGVERNVVFKTSNSFESRPAAVAAWLRQGEIDAHAIDCRPWDSAQFQETLLSLRPLTRKKDPVLFLSELQHRCAECGVALAIVRAPNGCRASGATRFLPHDKALLLLSFRHLSDDHFWFAFFHEAGHLLLHGNELFLEGIEAQTLKQEDEANEFAANILIPAKHRAEFMGLRSNARDIVRFARKISVSPGIVVGQLQHSNRIPMNHLNRLKRRFEWIPNLSHENA